MVGTMNANLSNAIYQKYGIKIIGLPQKIDGGYLSDNYSVKDNLHKYFLKKYRNKYNEQDVINIHKVKKFFSENGIPIIMPLTTNAGESYFEYLGNYYSLFLFVEAKMIDSEKASLGAIESMAQMQAKIHLLGKNNLPKIHEKTVSLWHKSRALQKGRIITEILSRIEKPNSFDKMTLEFVPWKISKIKENTITPSSLGLKYDHLLHGDYHSQNLFFDEQDNISHVYDLEKTVYAPRSYELVRAIDYICLTDFDVKKAGYYLKSYRKIYPISDSEFRRGFIFYLMKGIHTFWIEEAHYLENNTRTDVFYEGDMKSTKYYFKNQSKLISSIITNSK